jgi:hypothetical protein
MKKERDHIQSHARCKILPACDNRECPLPTVNSIDQRNTLSYLLEMECDDETKNQNLL